MFVEQPLETQTGNREFPLAYILRRLEQGAMKLPDFQRGKIWKADKIRGWFNTIMSGDAIGVIVTYQLRTPEYDNHYPIYLADGLQRLSATKTVLENPRKYGFKMSNEQAWAHVESFFITVQHRIYENHDEGYAAYRNLNRGSAMTPAEYYKGELVKDPRGNYLYENVLEVIENPGRHFTNERRSTAKHTVVGRDIRDSLALFYQYTSRSKETTFWQSDKGTINENDNPIERILYFWINENDPDMEKALSDFSAFINQQAALIYEVLAQSRGSAGYSITVGLYRGFLHLGVWRRNVGISTKWQCDVISSVFEASPKGTTTLAYLDHNNKPAALSLRVGTLTRLFQFCEIMGLSIPEISRKRFRMAPGYDASHQRPFSEYGDGDVVPEPASINRARGAQPIDEL